MKTKILLVIVIITFQLICFCQENTGPVLKPELIGKYDGKVKKGLAHGKGTAIGSDSYSGDFIKGLPHGKGEYMYSAGIVYKGEFKFGKRDGKGILITKSGNNEQIQEGYWENDNYVGRKRIDPYEVYNKIGGVQEHIFFIGEGNKIEISVLDPFSKLVQPQIFAEGKFVQKSYYGREYYEEVVFPISFEIKYTCSNKLRTGVIANTIRIKINKPGNWNITLKN